MGSAARTFSINEDRPDPLSSANWIIFVLGVLSLRQDSPDAADLAVSLAQLKDWSFLFGPGYIVPFGNGLLLGYVMYKSGLVPRRMALFD